ncbi:MAG: ShlB/FhaC/HecB family hemolysin secretion/activation protein [Goleter apudmare HA4340-LM2]|nr:ShlB/FhaC/HecB family hemolysin secretion/activation protein [Goleter apudmare HA4340-LM2]
MIFFLWASYAIASPNTLLKKIATSPTPHVDVVAQNPSTPKVTPASEAKQKNEASASVKCVSVVQQDNSLQSQAPSDLENNQPSEASPAPTPENNQPQETDKIFSQPSPNTTPENSQPPTTDKSFLVKKIDVRDYQILSAEEIKKITQPLEGRNVTLQELANAADQITALYLNRGYITSRAVLVDQTVDTGEIVIRVFEGGVDEIRVEGTERINPEYICSRIRLAGLNPLRKEKLEDQLILLRSDPIFKNIEASLRPADVGSKFGQSTIVVRVTEANSLKAALGVDNYSPPSVGSERLGVGLAYRNLVTSGDQIFVSYNRSTTGGVNLYDFSYRLPLNAMDGTLQLRAAISNSKITDPQFQNLNIRGDNDLYEILYSQPLIRSPREELALSLGFTYQDGQTFLFDNLPFGFGIGPDQNGVSRTSVFRFGQEYINRDQQGAWTARSLFNLGTGLFDATTNNHPIPDGRFFSWYGQIQRSQILNQDQLLIIGLDWQLTPDSLLASQQFVIGGAQTVRGYRQNTRSGDNGLRFSIEDQITILRNEGGLPSLQLAPFIDVGAVWNHPDNPNNPNLPRQRFLASGGLGLLWQPIPNVNVRLDYGIPFVNLSDRGNNFQDSGLHFSVYYQP